MLWVFRLSVPVRLAWNLISVWPGDLESIISCLCLQSLGITGIAPHSIQFCKSHCMYYILCMYVHSHMCSCTPWWTCRGQRAAFRSQLPTMWVLGVTQPVSLGGRCLQPLRQLDRPCLPFFLAVILFWVTCVCHVSLHLQHGGGTSCGIHFTEGESFAPGHPVPKPSFQEALLAWQC